jgi:hypothetical protein
MTFLNGGGSRRQPKQPFAVAGHLGELAAGNREMGSHLRDQHRDGERRLQRSLSIPRLILSALQVNIRGGRLPEPEDNGRCYLKLPLDAFSGTAWGEP